MSRYLFLLLYYSVLRYLPHSTVPILGSISESLRYQCCKHIFNKCGKNVNIGSKARFGKGFDIEIGDHSGIGINSKVPSNIKIGNYVMMGPNVTIHSANHNFSRTDIPMVKQGVSESQKTVIEDDVWIGSNVILLPGKHIRRGTIIGTGAVVTKDFPEYSIIAGNPAKLIKMRK